MVYEKAIIALLCIVNSFLGSYADDVALAFSLPDLLLVTVLII